VALLHKLCSVQYQDLELVRCLLPSPKLFIPNPLTATYPCIFWLFRCVPCENEHMIPLTLEIHSSALTFHPSPSGKGHMYVPRDLRPGDDQSQTLPRAFPVLEPSVQ